MRHVFTISALLVSVAVPLTAQAGFEFVMQGDQPAVTGSSQMPKVENDPVKADPLPLVEKKEPVAEVKKEIPKSSDGIPLTPVVKDSDALVISDMPLNMMASTAVTKEPAVQGFAKDVPLVLALQQIVPSNYRYSFGNGVSAGMRVDWVGGKPWKEVVADIASRNDMNVEIVSNIIAFRRKGVVPVETTLPTQRAMLPSPFIDAPVTKTVETKPAPKVLPITDNSSIVEAVAVPEESPVDVVAKTEMPMSLLEKPKVVSEDQEIAQETPPTEMKADTDSPLEIAAFSIPQEAPAKEKPDHVETAKPVASSSKVKKFFDDLFDFDGRSPVINPVKDKKIIADSAEVPEKATTDMAKIEETPIMMDPAPIQVEEIQEPAAAQIAQPEKPAEKDTVVSQIAEAAVTEPVLPPTVTVADETSRTTEMSQPVVDSMPAEPSALAATQEWQGQKGQTLRQVLTQWSEATGVSLVWSSEYDYPLQTDVRIQSSYPDAVRTMLAGFAKAKPRPLARLFRNQSVGAQPVLVVETDKLAQ